MRDAAPRPKKLRLVKDTLRRLEPREDCKGVPTVPTSTSTTDP